MKARFLFTLTKMFFCHFSDRLFVIGGGGYEGKGACCRDHFMRAEDKMALLWGPKEDEEIRL